MNRRDASLAMLTEEIHELIRAAAQRRCLSFQDVNHLTLLEHRSV